MSITRIAQALKLSSDQSGESFSQFLKEVGDKIVTNPDTGNKVKVKSLKGPKGQERVKKEYEKWKGSPKKTESRASGLIKGFKDSKYFAKYPEKVQQKADLSEAAFKEYLSKYMHGEEMSPKSAQKFGRWALNVAQNAKGRTSSPKKVRQERVRFESSVVKDLSDFEKAQQSTRKGWSSKEVSEIKKYTDQAYITLNGALREGGKTLDAELLQTLDNVFARSESPGEHGYLSFPRSN